MREKLGEAELTIPSRNQRRTERDETESTTIPEGVSVADWNNMNEEEKRALLMMSQAEISP